MRLTPDLHISMTKISFATWCLVVTEIYYHGLGNLCISHLIYVIKRYMDLPRHVHIYQPWYAVSPLCSAIVMTERKRMSYSSDEITRYDFSLHLCIFYRMYIYFICCVVSKPLQRPSYQLILTWNITVVKAITIKLYSFCCNGYVWVCGVCLDLGFIDVSILIQITAWY